MRLTKIVLICFLFIQPAFADDESATSLYDRAFPQYEGSNSPNQQQEALYAAIETILTVTVGYPSVISLASTDKQLRSFVATVTHNLAIEELRTTRPDLYQLVQEHDQIVGKINVRQDQVNAIEAQLKSSRTAFSSELNSTLQDLEAERIQIQSELPGFRADLENAKRVVIPAQEEISRLKATFVQEVRRGNFAKYRELLKSLRLAQVANAVTVTLMADLLWRVINAAHKRDSGVSPILNYSAEALRPFWESPKTPTTQNQ